MHQTIIGVAAPANAPNLGAVPFKNPYQISDKSSAGVSETGPSADASSRLHSRPLKHAALSPGARTIIGGLDAAKGSAPTPKDSSEPASLAEAKWNVVIPKQGTVQMTAPEIVRAFTDGKLTGDFNVWQDGLEGWKPIREVESLRTVFRRAGLPLEAVALPNSTTQPSPAPEARPATDQTFAAEPPTTRLNLSPEAQAQLQDAAASDGADDGITRIAASPWQVPDVGAQAAARLASSAGLPPRKNSTPPSHPNDEIERGHLPLERPSHRPDISPRETVRGQLAAISSNPAPPSITALISARDTQLLGPEAPLSEAESPVPALATSNRTLPDAPTEAHTNTIAQPETLPSLRSKDSSTETTAIGRRAADRSRRRRRWWLAWGLFVVIAALAVTSYRTKQPRSIYAYFHRRGWDVPLDRAVKRSVAASNQVTQDYVVRPYRAIAQRLHGRSGK